MAAVCINMMYQVVKSTGINWALMFCCLLIRDMMHKYFIIRTETDRVCHTTPELKINPFNASCFKLLLFEGSSAILV